MRLVLWRANSDVKKGCRRIKKTGRVLLSGRNWKHSPQLYFMPENIISVWERYQNRLLQRAAVQGRPRAVGVTRRDDEDESRLRGVAEESYPYRSVLEISTKMGEIAVDTHSTGPGFTKFTYSCLCVAQFCTENLHVILKCWQLITVGRSEFRFH
jgi:hypothetical protein